MALLPDLETAEQAYERGQIDLLNMLEGSSSVIYRTCVCLLARDDLCESVRSRVLYMYQGATSDKA
jgi:hypothetical protein